MSIKCKKSVSICIPTYNRAIQVEKSVKKCLDIPSDSFEVVVVDDASIDDTRERLLRIKDERFRYVKSEVNRGYSNMAFALKEGQGDYCLFLGDKDYLTVESWEKIESTIKNNAGVSIFHWKYIDEKGRIIHDAPSYYQKRLEKGSFEAELCAKYQFANSAAFMFRRNDIDDVWDYIDKKSLLWQLYPQQVLAMNLAALGDCAYLDSIVTVCRNEEREIHIQQAFAGESTPYWHPDSRREQNAEWIEFISDLNLPLKEKVHLSHTIIVNAIKQYGDYYKLIHNTELMSNIFYSKLYDYVIDDKKNSVNDWDRRISSCEQELLAHLRKVYECFPNYLDLEEEYYQRREKMKREVLAIVSGNRK